MPGYSLRNTFPERLAVSRFSTLHHIETLDPEQDHIQICHLIAGYEFPWDVTRALELALLKTFCIPSITQLLERTGEFVHRPQKRYDDTGLIVSELVKFGYESERGAAALERMNHIHGHFSISNRDYLYVLSTFIYEPIRWMDRFGWRPMCDVERLAYFYFWREIGLRMGIEEIPASHEEFEAFNQEFERDHFLYATSNQAIAHSTRDMFLGWFPKLLRPAVRPGVHALADESMRAAVGFPNPPAWLNAIVANSLKLRGRMVRRLPPRSQSSFYADAKHRSYPEGYSLDKLGPPSMVDKLNRRSQ
ncbi:MAG: oxygenase MpaB family protein [Cyanobacteria bacterium P01_E01_bin.34]